MQKNYCKKNINFAIQRGCLKRYFVRHCEGDSPKQSNENQYKGKNVFLF